VKKSKEGDLLVVRLADGEDLEKSLKQALEEEKVASGIVVSGLGMIRNAGLSFYVGKGRYETVPVQDPVELCGLSGNVSRADGETVLHLHAVVARRGGAAMAGHLSGAEVNVTAEIAVLATPQKLMRTVDPETGLKILGFD
jgi:predicted DNA-binding protein with PD1-like motif